MRLLKRQPGLPFLMALGVLLILSASFLAVQLWSDKIFRGAAVALEAPVMPPAMPTARKSGSRESLDKKIEKAKTVAAVEVVNAPEIQKTEVSAADENSASEPVVKSEKQKPIALKPARLPEMIEAPAMPPAAGSREKKAKAVDKAVSSKPAAAKNPVSESEKAVSSAVVEPVSEVEDSNAPAVEPIAQVVPVSEPVAAVVEPVVVVATSSNEPKDSVESKKKSVRRKKASRIEEDETVVPPEWNWFNTPLKVDFSDGHVVIVPVEKPREIRLLTVTAKLPDFVVSGASEDLEQPVSVEASSEKPFMTALARMSRLRGSRIAAVKKDPEIEKAMLARRSEVLDRMRHAVAALSEKLATPRPVLSDVSPAVVTSGAAAEDVSVDEVREEVSGSVVVTETVSEKTDLNSAVSTEHSFVPYYAGSGSELSNRVNDILARRIGFRRR